MISRWFSFLSVSFALFFGSPSVDSLGGNRLSAEDILAKVDEVRNPSESYEMRVRIGETLFDVLLEGNSKTLVRTLEPARDRDRDMLMLGEEMWAYIPNLKRAVRVSLSQKLTGQAANGDISRMRWSGDYSVQIASESATTWTLDLTANKKGLTYDKIRVEVEKKTFHPKTAEYQTSSAKPLKRASFGGYKMVAGRMRPTVLEIQSAVNTNDRSTLVVESMERKKFQASEFNPERFGR